MKWRQPEKLCAVFSASSLSYFFPVMAERLDPTGYGSRVASGGRFARLLFDGDERKFEQWLVNFLGYMRLQSLKDTILPADPAAPSPATEEF